MAHSMTHDEKKEQAYISSDTRSPISPSAEQDQDDASSNPSHPILRDVHTGISIVILFLNYFLSQYDKFILSYFQDSFSLDLDLNASQYAVSLHNSLSQTAIPQILASTRSFK